MRDYVRYWLDTHDGQYPEPGGVISDEHLLGVDTFLMKWSDRSPAAKVMLVGGGCLVIVCIALLILATVHVLPVEVLPYTEFPLLAVIAIGSVVGGVMDRGWQSGRAVQGEREDDGGST